MTFIGMPAVHLFADLRTWKAVALPARKEALASLARSLGGDWEAGPAAFGRHGLGSLFHAELGLLFVVIPGGWLRKGFSADDLFALASARTDPTYNPWNQAVDNAGPVSLHAIPPFLLAVDGLPPQSVDDAAHNIEATKAYHAAVRGAASSAEGNLEDTEPPMMLVDPKTIDELIPDGFRLPNEAELEWAFRECGTTRWVGVPADLRLTAENRWDIIGALKSGLGLRGFIDVENITADSWDANHADVRVARTAHTCWQDDDGEMIGLHAANRIGPDEFGEAIARLAFNLPGAADLDLGEAPPLAEHALLIAGLRDGDVRAKSDAMFALYLAGRHPAHLPETAESLVELIIETASMRVDLLLWLGDNRNERFVDELVPILDSDDAAERAATVHSLYRCEGAMPAFRERLLKEKDPGVRAGLILTLTRHGDEIDTEDDPLLEAATVIGRAERGIIELGPLLDVLPTKPTKNLFFAAGDLSRRATDHLFAMEEPERQRAAIIVATKAVNEKSRDTANVAIDLAFGPPLQRPTPRSPSDISDAQREVAVLLINADLAALHEHGVPDGPLADKRWAGIVAPGPCEQAVDVDGKSHPLWWALRCAQDPQPFFDALTPSERLLVFLERHVYRFRMPGELNALIADALADKDAALAKLREMTSHYVECGAQGTAELLISVVTLSGDIPPDPQVIRTVNDINLAHAAPHLGAFEKSAVEARMLAPLKETLAQAMAHDRWLPHAWSTGLRMSALLEHAPIPDAARMMLCLGWSGGQPARLRDAVAEHTNHPAIAKVLEEYDAMRADFAAWPEAREALLELWGPLLSSE